MKPVFRYLSIMVSFLRIAARQLRVTAHAQVSSTDFYEIRNYGAGISRMNLEVKAEAAMAFYHQNILRECGKSANSGRPFWGDNRINTVAMS